MAQSVNPPVFIKELYKDVQEHVCPLCTDGTKRSMEELLKHVQEGTCGAVIGLSVRTNETCLAKNRATWEKEICETLQHEHFIELVQQHLEKLMQVEARHNEEEKHKLLDKLVLLQNTNDSNCRKLSEIPRLQSELDLVRKTNRTYEQRMEDMTQHIQELNEKCEELAKEKNKILQDKIRSERREDVRNPTQGLDRENSALKRANELLEHFGRNKKRRSK
ncbi:hypothetical protein CYMTET_3013 [Cymbomonas tetramitiformis]|uniref:Uncharacterized protein n=1 Tax=Cymbomonas tetramitiformis TaxID=36881 RepID=A0AAE0LL98_9CHLO|nr:hypothetical protein CYMTET_3013 [Cymbomonas tetramitiformis]